MRTPRRFVLAVTALVLGACGGGDGGPDPVNCTAEARFGVGVSLTDADTGTPIEGATLTLTEAAYEETMWEVLPGEYAGAAERAGSYRLTIEAAGYESATREGILVTRDECHVIPVGLRIELRPL